MSLVLASIVSLVIIIVGFLMAKKMMKSPRQKEIEKELGDILKIKMRHHDLIVKELENGADEERHTALLADCLLYTSPSPRDGLLSRMPSSA